jgi:D-amino-acid dehydrogenase
MIVLRNGFGHLYVATGHGMLGVTLAPATGAVLAPLVLDDRTVPELEPFGLDRFAGRRTKGRARGS